MAKIVSRYSEVITIQTEGDSSIAEPLSNFENVIIKVREVYSDLNQYVPKLAAKVIDLSSVYQSIGNILATPRYTRLFKPEFGSDMVAILFEPMDEITILKLYDEAISAITTWENRVVLDTAQSTVIPYPEEHKYEVSLVFHLRGLSEDQFNYIGTFHQAGA